MTARVVLGILTGLVLHHPLTAAATPWWPYVGCWQSADSAVPQDARVCVVVRPDGAANITTSVSGEPDLEQRLVADGQERPVTEQECRGAQRMTFSTSGRHLFTRTELTCADGALRIVRSFATIAGDGTWINAQSIDVGGTETVGLRTYRRVDGTLPNASAFTFDDVVEASRLLSPRVVEAAIVAARVRFALDDRDLLSIRAAGVAPEVMDAMIAVSFPSHFVVQGPGSYVRWSVSDAPSPNRVTDSLSRTHVYAPFDLCYWRSWDPRTRRGHDRWSDDRIDVRRTPRSNASVTSTGYTRDTSPARDTAVERAAETTASEATPAPTRESHRPGYVRSPASDGARATQPEAVERSSSSGSTASSDAGGGSAATSSAPAKPSKGVVTKQGYTRKPPGG